MRNHQQSVASKLKFKLKPYKHQLKAIVASQMWPDMALLWEMGSGKSKGAIEILRLKYHTYGGLVPTIIFAPLITLPNWKEEFIKNSYIDPNDIVVLNKSGKARLKLIEEAVGQNKILVINYEAVISIPVFDLLKKFKAKIFVLDEAHKVKSIKSRRTKYIMKLCETANHRYLLTGTPILNNALDIFFPYKIMDGGKTFGPSFAVFQNKYFYDANGAWSGRKGWFPKWVARPEMFDELNRRIYSKALRGKKEDFLDLPPIIKRVVHVPLSPKQLKLYKDMEKDFMAFLDEEGAHTVASQAVVKALKMRQIVSGFIKSDDGVEHPITPNPRLQILEELIQEAKDESKVIVWACFKHDHRAIKQMLKDKFKWEYNLQYTLLTGEQSTQEKQDNMDRFRKDTRCRVVIATQSAAGIGVNLVEASVMIYYSRTYSLGEDEQSEARCHRSGSEIHKKILRIDLVASDTIDEVVHEALAKKQSDAASIIDMVRENNGNKHVG